ncbi:hypothetical protein JVX91_27915 [Pseudomonas sp. PDNC002]|uniref:hypothetical protein n=1 Tax=Pseudomonas sp. PDNC002 TaxID=2811422 RepID=UPI0019663862|nr:hypothetical protein [Pseudomonas sp. PDNC002]QRY79345.1 hypothetical protein JVX91_27915 [Pseudomonas sp. PDNC002]
MTTYHHLVSGVFARRSQADSARECLLELGLHGERVHVLDHAALTAMELPRSKQRVLQHALQRGAIGMLFGLLVSALVAIAMTRTGAGLFSGAPLVLLGWGTALGALVGALVGGSSHVSRNAHPFGYTLAPEHVILLAETHTVRESVRAHDIIEASPGVGAHMDISLV